MGTNTIVRSLKHLVDPTFLVRDLRQGLAQHPDVVDSERRDARGYGLRNNVGRVVRAADADLENGRVDLQDGERSTGMAAGIVRSGRTFSCRKTCMAMIVR